MPPLCIQIDLANAFHKNVVLAERAGALAKELQAARHRIRNHPALFKLQKEQDLRTAVEAEYNAAMYRCSQLSALNFECQAWKRRVLASNEALGDGLASREQVLLATSWQHVLHLSDTCQPQGLSRS